MKKIAIICLILASTVAHGFSEENNDVKLFAFISDTGTNGWFHLRITNCGDKEQTILTENFTTLSLGGSITTGSESHRMPDVWLRFEIMTMGTVDEPEQWKFIPSLPKLCPVTLRKGETATIKGVELDSEFMNAIRNNPNMLISIRYTIGDEIAERFGLWHGTLKTREVAKSLLNK